MMYSEAVTARFMHPQFAAVQDMAADLPTYQAKIGSQAQGAVLQLYVQVDTETQTVQAAYFKVYGCGACIATADILCERLLGLNIEAVSTFNTQDLATALTLPSVKMYCTWMAAEALEKITQAWQAANSIH